MNKEYEMIISRETFLHNKQKAIEKDRIINRKKILKNTLLIVVGVLIGLTLTTKTIKKTPFGKYTCYGKIIKVCSGSEEVADYLGV